MSTDELLLLHSLLSSQHTNTCLCVTPVQLTGSTDTVFDVSALQETKGPNPPTAELPCGLAL